VWIYLRKGRDTELPNTRVHLRAYSTKRKVGPWSPGAIHLSPDTVGTRLDLTILDIGTNVTKQKIWHTRIGIFTNPIVTLIQFHSHFAVQITAGDHRLDVGLAAGWRIGNNHTVPQGGHFGVRERIKQINSDRAIQRWGCHWSWQDNRWSHWSWWNNRWGHWSWIYNRWWGHCGHSNWCGSEIHLKLVISID